MEGRRTLTDEQARRLGVDPIGGGESDCADGVQGLAARAKGKIKREEKL